MRILSLAAVMAALLLVGLPTAWADEGEPDLVEIEEIEIVEEEAAPVEAEAPAAEVAKPANGVIVVPATPAPYVRPCPTPCAPPRQWIRPTREARCTTVTIPAVTKSYRVPVYEDVEVPLYRYECKPIMREASWPDMARRCVPVMKTRMVPVYKEREVPVTRQERIPITRTVCDPCTGEQKTVNCGCRYESVPCGTRTVKYLACWRKEQVQCGTRLEWYRRGTFTRPVQCGNKVERTQIGCRTEKRLVGWRCESMVVQPAREVQQTQCVTIPGRWVEAGCR